MPNYSKGKIYKIWSPSTELIYIGSTTQSLSKRMSQHRCKRETTSQKVIDCGDARIDLIECFPCSSKEELNKREGEIILQTKCINRVVPSISTQDYCRIHSVQPLQQKEKVYKDARHEILCRKKREFHHKHRDVILEKSRKYREDNREEILRKKREYHKKYQKEIYARRRKYLINWEKQRVVCECGCEVSRGSLLRHKRRKIHQENLCPDRHCQITSESID